MRTLEALRLITGMADEPAGYIVVFQRKRGGPSDAGSTWFVSHFDNFPDVDAGEPPIRGEAEAWALARAFAQKSAGWTKDVRVIPWPKPASFVSDPETWLNPTWKPAS